MHLEHIFDAVSNFLWNLLLWSDIDYQVPAWILWFMCGIELTEIFFQPMSLKEKITKLTSWLAIRGWCLLVFFSVVSFWKTHKKDFSSFNNFSYAIILLLLQKSVMHATHSAHSALLTIANFCKIPKLRFFGIFITDLQDAEQFYSFAVSW